MKPYKKIILVYHSIDCISKKQDPYKINVSPVLFEKQMAYISKSKRKESFIISFDDSFGNIYQNAFPVIKKFGLKAILFITTGYVDGRIRLNFKPLTWDGINHMKDWGIELGSHSVSHSNMAMLSEKDAYSECLESKQRIFDMTGCEVESFCYPYGCIGSFNETTKALLIKAGYKKGYVNIMGMDNSKSEPYQIRRIRIYSTDNMFRFKLKVTGLCNWADYFIQRLSVS